MRYNDDVVQCPLPKGWKLALSRQVCRESNIDDELAVGSAMHVTSCMVYGGRKAGIMFDAGSPSIISTFYHVSNIQLVIGYLYQIQTPNLTAGECLPGVRWVECRILFISSYCSCPGSRYLTRTACHDQGCIVSHTLQSSTIPLSQASHLLRKFL